MRKNDFWESCFILSEKDGWIKANSFSFSQFWKTGFSHQRHSQMRNIEMRNYFLSGKVTPESLFSFKSESFCTCKIFIKFSFPRSLYIHGNWESGASRIYPMTHDPRSWSVVNSSGRRSTQGRYRAKATQTPIPVPSYLIWGFYYKNGKSLQLNLPSKRRRDVFFSQYRFLRENENEPLRR